MQVRILIAVVVVILAIAVRLIGYLGYWGYYKNLNGISLPRLPNWFYGYCLAHAGGGSGGTLEKRLKP